MKKIVSLIILSLFIVNSVCFADYQVLRSSTVSVGGSFTPPETIGSLPLIDDFNDGGTLNSLGGATGTFLSAGGDGTMNVSTVSVGTNNYAAKIDYTIRNTSTYGGYYTKLQSSSFTPYGYLYIDVRGASGGEYFKIQLQTNTGTNTQANLMITDVLSTTLTTSWQTVVIPLLSFYNLTTISSMKELVFVFEGAQELSQNGKTLPHSGSIYVDNIRVVTGSTPSTLLIDNFNDRVGTCSLGGNIANFSPSGTGTTSSLNGSILTCNYTLSASESYAGQAFILGGGVDGWVAVPRTELVSYNAVSLTASTSNNPNVKVSVKADVVGKGTLDLFRYFVPSGTRVLYFRDFQYYWNNATESFTSDADFKAKVTAIREVAIVCERGGGSDTTSVTYDDIKFVK